MLPNFILAGAPRCGTTWLYDCFCEHPEIYVPQVKEVRYFNNYFDEGIEWYEKHFEKFADEKAVGELSPTYVDHPDVPQRIHDLNPDMKLIFSFRNPIERAYSAYCISLSNGAASENVNAELEDHSSFINRSLYFEHLSRFFKYFGKDQIKIMIFDDMKTDAGHYLYDIFSFLSVNSDFRPRMLNKSSNKLKSRKLPPLVKQPLNFIKKVMVNRSDWAGKLLKNLRRKGFGNFLYGTAVVNEFPQISPEKIRHLKSLFKEDVMQLSDFINRDLSHWLK